MACFKVKSVFNRQELQMFDLKLNKYEQFSKIEVDRWAFALIKLA